MAEPKTVPIDAGRARTHLPPAAVHIDGSYVMNATGERHTHIHPGDGAPLGEWTLAGEADVDRAVLGAQKAQPYWASMDPAERRVVLNRVADALRERAVDLAAVVTLEMGMPIRTAVIGAHRAADWFAYYAGWTDKIDGLVAPVSAAGAAHDYATPVPYGVVGAIIPWNGPLIGLAVKVAPALAAGNAVVLKPSEFAPLSAALLARIATEAGLPAGLLNVVCGGPGVGERLCRDPGVGIISFTGGNNAARAVGHAAADRQVPTVFELGGKSASLLFDDCDVARAARIAAVLGTAQNSGQGCFLPTRLLVQRGIYERTLEILRATAETFVVGRPFDPETVQGPVASQQSFDRILGVIEKARDEGAGRILTGGRPVTGPDLADGYYIEPTVFVDVDPASSLATQEVFGPVLSVIPFDDEDEAVTIANGVDFGLAGYVWTENLRRAHRVAGRLDAGYVSVNSMATLPPGAPFGGWKSSGHGVEGGRQGLLQLMRTKNVHVAL
ncbi:aldehyde dehydrogenase family protein [Rhodococcus koreensis]